MLNVLFGNREYVECIDIESYETKAIAIVA